MLKLALNAELLHFDLSHFLFHSGVEEHYLLFQSLFAENL